MKMKTSKKSEMAQRKISKPSVRLRIQEILATTDFSDQSLAGVRYAAVLGRKIGASLTLLHVVEVASSMSGMESVMLARADAEVVALAQTQLEALAKREAMIEGKVTKVVRTGKPFHEIALASSECGVDLIVIATHGYTGAKRVLLGSTAERVVRHAACSVLTIPTRMTPSRIGKTTPIAIKKILVPIDFSKISEEALPWAAFLAAQYGAEIILLHIAEKSPFDYLLGRELTSHLVMPSMKQAEANLENIAGSLSKDTGGSMSVVVRNGRPFEEICHTAKKLGADMIVMTTRGHTGLKHVWLGSTAERVVRHAHCPVLVVRGTKA